MTKPHACDRLRILLASRAPFVGGAELAAERLACGLALAGHDVRVALPERNEVWRRMQEAGVELVQLPVLTTDARRFWNVLGARGKWRRFLHEWRPHLVHSNDIWTHQVVAMAARGTGVRTACHHRFPYDQRAIDWLIKYGSDRHLFVSEALMAQMCVVSPRLASEPRAVVYDGLTLPEPPDDAARADARRVLGLPEHKTLVLFAGQVIERKGVADLLRAWSMLSPACRRRAELVIVGDDLAGQGAYRRQMQELDQRVWSGARFVGFQREVAPWLRAADIAVVPSHVEPLGNATLEAMSHGLPVVGCAVGGIPEMVVEGQTGLLPPAQSPTDLSAAIEKLLLNSAMARRMGQQGRRRCEEIFSLQAHTAEVLEQYRIILAHRAAVGDSRDPIECIAA